MELREQNFFATQLPSSNRYFASNQKSIQQSQSSVRKNPTIRIREVKSQMKKVAQSYNNTLKDFMKAKRSLEKTNQQTHKLRTDFLKLYGNKKLKVQNRSLMDSNKQQIAQERMNIANRTRSMKMSNQLNLMCTKNQWQNTNNRIKQENSHEFQNLKKMIRLKRKQEFDQAKQKFMQVKQSENQHNIRKKNLSAMISTRARHNYLLKINQEMQILQGYQGLLDKISNLKINQFSASDGFNKQDFSKTFFVTTKNSFNN